VQVELQKNGIGVGVHYPVPLHRQPAYEHLGMTDGALPITERVAARILSLPMYPELTSDHIEAVTRAVIEAVAAQPLG
jgi:dTDP-4-amino-4,6-dideoxygalactose transaminase